MSSDLGANEPHPAARSAMAFVRECPDLPQWMEAFASCALEGNRVGEICCETLRRVLHGEPISDRYILGLAWTIAASQDTFLRLPE